MSTCDSSKQAEQRGWLLTTHYYNLLDSISPVPAQPNILLASYYDPSAKLVHQGTTSPLLPLFYLHLAFLSRWPRCIRQPVLTSSSDVYLRLSGNEHHGPDHILAALTQHLQKLRNKCGNNPVVHNMSSQEVQRLSDGYHVVVCL